MTMKHVLIIITVLCLATRPFEAKSQSLFQRVARFATGKAEGDIEGLLDDVPSAKLSNDLSMPLVGLGVGNMVSEIVPAMVSHAVRSDKKIRLFDTSGVSQNEHLVAKGIVEGVEAAVKYTDDEKVEIHVITKVWYTHLGYERTMLAVQSSLENLRSAIEHPNVQFKLHVLLHWPRCYDAIPWMNCEQEENDLPEEVKLAGPPPHTDKESAWKESWRALEALYNDKDVPVSSIGVSNFHLKELQEMERTASVQPHIVETNTWSLLYDPLMVGFCHKRNIHLAAFHLMAGVVHKSEEATFAYHHLQVVANQLTREMRRNSILPQDRELTAAQVVLAWLVQHSVTVIPRTTDLGHLNENSAVSLQKIPAMSEEQVKTVSHSVEALISGEDVEEDAYIDLTFHALTKDVYIYWHDHEFDGEIQVALIEKGQVFEEQSHPGHSFRIYDKNDRSKYELFTVEGNYGDEHHIEL